MNNVCYIVAASDAEGIFIDKIDGDILISADAGLKHLEKLNMIPDIAVGDFDSYGKYPDIDNIILLPCEKDDTDTAVALSEGYSRGYRNFIIYGGLGKRLDHTIANIQNCVSYAEKGCRLCLWNCGESVYVINSSSLYFDENAKGTVSVFSDSKTYGVTIKNLKYPLDNYELSNTYPIGVSNEFIGKECSISANKGSLIVVTYEDAYSAVSRIRND